VTFTAVVSATFYAMFLGLFVLARRLFSRPLLAAPLLVCVVIVRYYGVLIDANATPQVTPMRLELWIPLLAVALATGLRHWCVGLTLGALCFFSRSIGTLYLGAYALALAMDFLAERQSLPAAKRGRLIAGAIRYTRASGLSLALIAAAFVLVRLVFGRFGSDAVALYRELGVGMMRIAPGSFYWWLLPLTGALAWLAVSRRGSLSPERGQATIFAVTLLIANFSYFFGRSHEHNLINLSSSCLFCGYLALDLAWPSTKGVAARLFALAPFGLLAACAYFYSGRVSGKVSAQAEQLVSQRRLSPTVGEDFAPLVDCSEIARAAPGTDVFFFARYDYWFYERCDYVPPGYVQPLQLAVLKQDVITQLNAMLDKGYVVVVPQQVGEWAGYFAEFSPALGELTDIETAHYRFYRRKAQG